jgi:Restriction endonuclease
MTPGLDHLRTLVLNADMQPLSWAPLSVWSWQDALVAVLQERVIQVKTYEDTRVRTASTSFEVPAVIALKGYRRRENVAFTRYHVFLRDEFRCQYCGNFFPARKLHLRSCHPEEAGRKIELDEHRRLLLGRQHSARAPDAEASRGCGCAQAVRVVALQALTPSRGAFRRFHGSCTHVARISSTWTPSLEG